jgi:hypothetical protein
MAFSKLASSVVFVRSYFSNIRPSPGMTIEKIAAVNKRIVGHGR